MLVSPTEPSELRRLGKTSLVPEQYGADFLFASTEFGLVGVQRKELSDFVASVQDGRLGKELGMMKRLGLALLVLEGRALWTNDGLATWTSTRWRATQHLGTLWSVQLSGCWVSTTTSVQETSTLISAFTRWTAKPRHIALESRPGPAADEWGKVGNREWAIHLLQGFRGIGPTHARNIYEHFGSVPLVWSVGLLDLVEVPGIGAGTAERLMDALGGEDGLDESSLS